MSYYPSQQNAISTVNSTTTPLSGAATFTGTWEDISKYSAICVNAVADVDGTLYGEFSTDASATLRSVQLSSGAESGAFGIHLLAKVAQYFRVRLVNGAGAQASLTITTLLNVEPLLALPTSRASQVLTDYSDVLNVRNVTDELLDEALGRNSSRTVVQKFGRNPAVGSGTTEDIWSAGGLYTGFLTAASAVRVKSGGNTNDTSAGTGARTITIVGLDANFAAATETVTTAGASASAATTTTFIRVFRAYVASTGTYGGNNTGDVVIETTGGTVMASVEAGFGQTQLAIYTIPAGYTGFIRRLSATVDGSKASSVYFYQRANADTVSAPFSPKRLIFALAGLTGNANLEFKSYKGPYAAKTDIWVQAVGGTGGPGISASFDVVLVTA